MCIYNKKDKLSSFIDLKFSIDFFAGLERGLVTDLTLLSNTCMTGSTTKDFDTTTTLGDFADIVKGSCFSFDILEDVLI